MSGKRRKILSERDKHTLMKNQKISTESNGMHYLDDIGTGRKEIKND